MPKRREGPTKSKATGYYYFDSFIGFPPNRKRVRVSLRTRDPAKAQWLWEQEYKRLWSEFYGIEQKKKPIPVKLSEISEEFIDYERDIKKVKEWKILEGRLNIVMECWGDLYLKDINEKKLSELDRYLRENKKSPKTINHYMGILKTLFYYAIKSNKFSGENPICDVKFYITDKKRREYSIEEIGKIIKAAEKIEKDPYKTSILQRYAKRIVILLLSTGMRPAELLNLKWGNIKGDKIVLQRSETKQKKEKIVPITKRIAEILESMKDKGKSLEGYIIPRRKNKNITAYSTKTLTRRIRELSGIKDFIFYGLRHTASTKMVSEALGRGVGLADIMKILGHSRPETTLQYQHEDFKRMKKAVEILERKTVK